VWLAVAERWLAATRVPSWCLTSPLSCSPPGNHAAGSGTGSKGRKGFNSWSLWRREEHVLGTCVPEVAPWATLFRVGLLQKSSSSLQPQSTGILFGESMKNSGATPGCSLPNGSRQVLLARHPWRETLLRVSFQPACSQSPNLPSFAWNPTETPWSCVCVS